MGGMPGGPMGGMPPGGPMMGPMGGPPPKKKGSGMIIGAAVGAVVLIGGGVAAYMLLGRSAGVFPCDIAKLPSDTESISREQEREGKQLGLSAKDIPEQAKWSKYASLVCGGENVFALAERSTGSGAKYSADEIAKLNPKDAEKYLACGKAFAEKEKGNSTYQVRSSKEGVMVLTNGLEEYPGSTKAVKSGKDIEKLTAIQCVAGGKGEGGEKGDKEEKSDEKCAGQHIGRVADTNLWVVGNSRKSVETFAEGFSPDGSKGIKDKDKDGFEAMASKVSGFTHARVGKGEATVARNVFSSAAKADREDQEKLMKDLKDFEVYFGHGETRETSGGKEVLYMKAKDEKAAGEIVGKLEKLYKLHKSGLKERQEEREKFEESEAKAKEGKDGDEKEDKVTKAYSKAIDAMTSRAYKDDVKIEASGDMVTVTVEYKAEKDETTAIEEFGQKQKEKFEAAAEFVDALAGGKAPSEAVLKKLGGSKLVEAVSKAKESLPKKDD